MFSLDFRDTDDHLARASGTTCAAGPVASPAATYDPTLIKHLKSDHAGLQDSLVRLEDHAQHRQFAKIPGTLARFRSELHRHIEEENLHFYAYVAHALREDPLVAERLDRTSARMAGIARLVTLFTRHYTDIPVTPTNRDAFIRDLDVIASLLGDRIELEESTLYALYQPPCRAGQLPDEDCLLSLECVDG